MAVFGSTLDNTTGFGTSEMSTSEQECGLEACERTSRWANRQWLHWCVRSHDEEGCVLGSVQCRVQPSSAQWSACIILITTHNTCAAKTRFKQQQPKQVLRLDELLHRFTRQRVFSGNRIITFRSPLQ